jgi:hypothetical protein
MKPDAVMPSKNAAPAMAFLRGQKPIMYESFGNGEIRRYQVGKRFVIVQTICEMKRPIRLWMIKYGGK